MDEIDRELEQIGEIFKGFFLLLICWLWIPALLIKKLYNWMR